MQMIEEIKQNVSVMNLLKEYDKKYKFFRDITGVAMRVYNKYHYGLLESAYEAAIKYLLEQMGYGIERQVYLPIYWDDVQLDQTYRMDLVVNGSVIVELKSVPYIESVQRRQLWNYMNLTHMQYGMLVNFSPKNLYTEWYERNSVSGDIDKIN